MTEDEVILVDAIPPAAFSQMLEEAVKYAIISLPFTVNRMALDKIVARITNIAKGKIAETMFYYFCEMNAIVVDHASCSTPFWDIDKRDFLLNAAEWDIKNNYIFHQGKVLPNHLYTDLPALVPNKSERDQWNKRKQLHFRSTGSVKFLFTFMKLAGLEKGSRDFFKITLAEEQIKFLMRPLEKYKGEPQTAKPFDEDKFWNAFNKVGSEKYFDQNDQPNLVITGFAGEEDFDVFRNTGPKEVEFKFSDSTLPTWYERSHHGYLNFMNGTLRTKIRNATLPIKNLPSFLSLFPQLKEELKCARLKDP